MYIKNFKNVILNVMFKNYIYNHSYVNLYDMCTVVTIYTFKGSLSSVRHNFKFKNGFSYTVFKNIKVYLYYYY